MSVNTIAESGLVRIYRDLTAGDIDIEKAMLEIRNDPDGLVPTMLDGHVNSARVSDASGLSERKVVRGDGVNTLLADSAAIGTTTNILGMTLTGQVSGANARFGTPGSIIDGFGGTLTKHAVYYLSTSGGISTSPGAVEVVIGIAIDTDKLLFAPCCCAKVGTLTLNYCFSGALFTCDDGATYCIDGPGYPDCIPALCFEPGVDQSWYCGFETPNDMDPAQAADLDIIFYPAAAPANPTQLAISLRSVPLAASIFAGGTSYAPAVVNPTPAGAAVLSAQTFTIPASTFTLAQMNRLTFQRQGANAGDTFAGNIYVASVQLKYLVRCSN